MSTLLGCHFLLQQRHEQLKKTYRRLYTTLTPKLPVQEHSNLLHLSNQFLSTGWMYKDETYQVHLPIFFLWDFALQNFMGESAQTTLHFRLVVNVLEKIRHFLFGWISRHC